MTAPLDIDIERLSPEAFARLVAEHDDDTLVATFRAAGTAAALDRIFADMQDRARPEKIAGEDATVQWYITDGDDRHAYEVVLSDGTCRTRRGEAGDPDTTLTVDLPRFARIAAGQASGVKLLLTRKLRASGDINLARRLEGFFARPSA